MVAFHLCQKTTPSQKKCQGNTYHILVLSTSHRLDIVVDKSCLDEDLDRLVTRRAFLFDFDICADVSATTCLLFQSCSRTVLGKDGLGMSTLISVNVEVAHFRICCRINRPDGQSEEPDQNNEERESACNDACSRIATTALIIAFILSPRLIL